LRALLTRGLAASLLVSFAPAPAALQGRPVHSFQFKVLAQGSYGFGSLAPSDAVITSQPQWVAYWQQAMGSSQPPYVNFREEIVLGLLMGYQSTSGYWQAVTDVTSDGNQVGVSVEDHFPGLTCMVLQVITNPYLLVKISRTNLPVFFHHNAVVTKC
jgi:protease stability complex PrcB-like protein